MQLRNISGKKGILKDLQLVIEGAGEQTKDSDVFRKSTPNRQNLEASAKVLADLQPKIEKVSPGDMQKLENDIAAAADHSQTLINKCSEHISAVKYKNESAKTKQRAVYLHNRFQVNKVRGWLTAAGFPKALAGLMSARVCKLGFLEGDVSESTTEGFESNLREHDFNGFGMWTKTDGTKIDDLAKGTQEAHESLSLQRAMDAAELELQRKKTWTGCMQFLPSDVNEQSDLTFMHEKVGVDKEDKCPAQLCSVRKHALHVGTIHWPFVGVGSFVYILGGEWVFTMMEVAKMLEKGLVLRDFESFCKTAGCVDFAQENSPSFRLTAGCWMFIPFGFVVIPALIQCDKKDKKCAHFVCYPAMAAALAKKLPPNVWAAIHKESKDCFAAKTENTYKMLRQVIDDFHVKRMTTGGGAGD